MMNEIKEKAINAIAAATRAVFSPDVKAEDIVNMVNYMLAPSYYIY